MLILFSTEWEEEKDMAYLTDTAIFDEEKKILLFQEIGNNILKLRKRNHLSRWELSLMANISIDTVRRIEDGETFSGSSLINIIIALQVDIGEIIPLRKYMQAESDCEKFVHLTDSLDSYEMNGLFRMIELYANAVKRGKN